MAGPQDDDSTRVDLPQIDTATYVAASFYGPVALPLHVSFAQAAAIEEQANQLQKLESSDTFTIGGASGGPIAPTSKAERQRHEDEEFREYLITIGEEQDERREREREEWSRSRSTVGGVTMTGAEWGQLAERLRSDEELRQRIIDAFKKRGMSETEAEARLERVAEVTEITAIPPAQRTDDQKRTISNAESDPSLKADMAMASSLAAPASSNPKSELQRDFMQATDPVTTPTQASTNPAPKPLALAGLDI